MRLSSILACVAATPLLIAASEPLRLQPSSPWVVDYAENSCRLIRMFGDPKHRVKLAFQSEAPGSMDMIVIGRPLSTWKKEVNASFNPVGITADSGKVGETADQHDPVILWSHVAFQTPAAVETDKKRSQYFSAAHIRPPATSLSALAAEHAMRHDLAVRTMEIAIETRPNRFVVLETGSMGDAIKAFDKCSHDSLKDWGVDPDVQDKIVRPVWSLNTGQWLFADDYPRRPLVRGEESVVQVRLLVDATGRVTNCVSLSHFNEVEFNRVTCAKITERARFEPAELADGTKVPSYFLQYVTYQLAP